jgi:hypothetical protein
MRIFLVSSCFALMVSRGVYFQGSLPIRRIIPRSIFFFLYVISQLIHSLQNYSCYYQIPWQLLVSTLYMHERESSGFRYKSR